MKNIFTAILSLVVCAGAAFAQTSAPAPGAGGAFTPNGGPGGFGGATSAPAPGAGGPFTPNNSPGWGGGPGWGTPWNSGVSISVNAQPYGPGWSNSGVTNVVGVGFDAQGNYQTVPMTVSYNYLGAGQYNVTVLNAWNPWSDLWNRGIDQPAYNTTYYFGGNTYDFYTNLSTGTYYFNL